jgi:hypothetical protein
MRSAAGSPPTPLACINRRSDISLFAKEIATLLVSLLQPPASAFHRCQRVISYECDRVGKLTARRAQFPAARAVYPAPARPVTGSGARCPAATPYFAVEVACVASRAGRPRSSRALSVL